MFGAASIDIRRPEPSCSKEPQRSERRQRPSLSHTRLSASRISGKSQAKSIGENHISWNFWGLMMIWKNDGKIPAKSDFWAILPKKTLEN